MNRFRRSGERTPVLSVRSHLVHGEIGSADDLSQVRWEFGQWLQRHFCLDDSRRNDLTLAINEALTNAVEFGYQDHNGQGPASFVATYEKVTQTLTVTVSNRGRWRLRSVESTAAAKPFVNHGHGIALMRLLTDGFRIIPSERGTRVSLLWTDVRQRFPVVAS